jgi:AraC-like DNA-binding protein
MEGNEMPPAFQQVLTPEQLASAIRSADFEPCQLSPRPSPSRLARLMCAESICLDFVELGPSMLFTGVMPKDSYTLIFVTHCPTKGHAFNFAIEHLDGYLGLFPPGAQLDAHTPMGYSNATLTVHADEFHRAIERWIPGFPDKLLKSGGGMLVGAAEQTRLRILLNAAMEGIVDPFGPFSDRVARREMGRLLLEAFLAALRSGVGGLVPSPNCRVAGRLRHLREAREFIRTSAQGPIQVEDLSQALGMSPRGVEVLFRSSLGIAPNAYIRHQRLHGVRRSLLTAKPGPGAIKETALKWGFWHMGHFSKSYRQLFGESPMQTLQAWPS